MNLDSPFPLILEKIGDLNPKQVEKILLKARNLKKSSYGPLLIPQRVSSHFTVATFFEEESTRTQLSFILAAKRLGATVVDLHGKSSSRKKGESLEDTFITFKSMGVHCVVYRGPDPHSLQDLKKLSPLKIPAIINGGDGKHEHPTQALLDLFTMIELTDGPFQKKITILGDCLHSRVCHSLTALLSWYPCEVTLCGPPHFLPQETPDIFLQNLGIKPEYTHPQFKLKYSTSTEESIPQTDLLYLLRIQKERHQDIKNMSSPKEHLILPLNEYVKSYGMTHEKLKKWHRNIPIYHAGPTNIGLEIDDQLIRGPWYRGEQQVAHSLFLRMALMECIAEEIVSLNINNQINVESLVSFTP